MRDAPQNNGCQGGDADEPLHAGEFVSDGPDGDDVRAFGGIEGKDEEAPDEEDGDYADGEGDEEPNEPARVRGHVLQRDDVLGRGDRGGCAADVGGESDS